MTVTKQDLVDSLSKKTGMSKNSIYKLITLLLEEIRNHFIKGRKIELRGFGTFYQAKRKARTFKVPRTGEEREVAERKILGFKASRQLFIFKNPRKGSSGD